MKRLRTPKSVLRALSDAGSALLCAHIGPDGDTIGSVLALGAALEALGKRVQLTCADPVPELYAFMPGSEKIVMPDALAGEVFDLAVAVDVSDSARLGGARVLFDAASVRAVIDHHATNDGFGDINWVAPQAAATGMLVLACVKALGVPLTLEIAEHLYVAVSTDTGNFRFANTDAAVLRSAAVLAEAGARPDRLTALLFYTRSLASVALRGRALSTLRLFAGGRAAVMALTAQDFAQTGATDSMTEGIVNYAIEIIGVEVAILARERDGEVKCSLRAKEPFDVAVLAQQFGGGGHALAAGCSLSLPIQDALPSLEQAVEELLQ